MITNQLVNLEYYRHHNASRLDIMQEEIQQSKEFIDTINEYTRNLKAISSKQRILALNASIEAARSGEAGAGFSVVAKSMQDLSTQSEEIYGDIEQSVNEITKTFSTLSSLFEE